jgi:hypothetical protein
MASKAVELRTYAFVDRLQPQLAALLGGFISGDPVLEGMAQLYIEIAPGSDVYRLVDAALKASDVRPGSQVVERQYGMTELHAFSQEAVKRAGATILEVLGLGRDDITQPELVSSHIISNVDANQAQLINRTRRGSLLLAGRSMLVVECVPAAYISAIANEVEKHADVTIVDVVGVGAFGRLWVSGTEAEAQSALDAVHGAFERRPWTMGLE